MKSILIILFYLLCLTELVHAKEVLIIIGTRQGVIQKFLLLEPNNPVSSVILCEQSYHPRLGHLCS